MQELQKMRKKAGKNARQDLLEAATYLFGLYGYDGVTTRMIVAKAAVNISTLHYYYKSKHDLYDAVLHNIASFVNKNIAEQLVSIKHLLEEMQVERKTLLVALIALINTLARKLITREPLSFGLVVVREQIMPSPSFNTLFNESLWPIHQMIECLIARLTAREHNNERVILESHALLGQVLGFIATRTVVLRIMGLKSYNHRVTEEICQVIEENIRKLYGNCVNEGE